MNMNEEYEDGMYREVEDENNPVYDYDDQSIETGYSQPAEERSSFMQNLTLANKQISTNLSLAQNIGGLYSDCIKYCAVCKLNHVVPPVYVIVIFIVAVAVIVLLLLHK